MLAAIVSCRIKTFAKGTEQTRLVIYLQIWKFEKSKLFEQTVLFINLCKSIDTFIKVKVNDKRWQTIQNTKKCLIKIRDLKLC